MDEINLLQVLPEEVQNIIIIHPIYKNPQKYNNKPIILFVIFLDMESDTRQRQGSK